MKNLNVLYLPGIGGDKSNSHKTIMKNIRKELGGEFNFNVYLVDYLRDINENQKQNYDRMIKSKKGKYMRWFQKPRKVFLNSLGDAITIFSEKKVYKAVMRDIQTGLKYLHENHPNDETIVITHSLGCQLFSCYMWDSRHEDWDSYNEKIKIWFSYGNNMRGFMHGRYFLTLDPFPKPNKDFKWINFFSWSDLLLGYHMTNINQKYDSLLSGDVHIQGFPFFSHSAYDKNKKVIKTIVNEILKL